MAFCVCKCLNVSLVCEEFTDFITGESESTLEQKDLFFDEKLLLCSTSTLKICVAQPALTGKRFVCGWILYLCFGCGMTTHAVDEKQNKVLIRKSIQSTPEVVENLKKSSNFSSVFNLLLPEITGESESKENINTNIFIYNNTKEWPHAQQAIGNLKDQLNQTLQTQLNAVEETVRQFRDQKYAEYEAYREKAQRDHNVLTSIVKKMRGNVDNDGWKIEENPANEPSSPRLPPLQRRRLSSLKDVKKIPYNFRKSAHASQEEDSLDAEDLFDLEGTDQRNDMLSDQDDYDSDDGSNDEGIQITRPRGGFSQDIARSLPINMPKFVRDRSSPRDLDYEEGPQDIAASIKALAQSVHDDFFELPRPRFCTQI